MRGMFGYAPYDDPEIAVIAFVYNGTEGSQIVSANCSGSDRSIF